MKNVAEEWECVEEEVGCGGEFCRFCSLERSGHGRSPVESAGRTLEGISEGLEQAGGVGKETAVEVDQAKETLEILNSVWLRVVENGVNIGGKRSDASGGDLMT